MKVNIENLRLSYLTIDDSKTELILQKDIRFLDSVKIILPGPFPLFCQGKDYKLTIEEEEDQS